jgi:di/tricarboxylate transporter
MNLAWLSFSALWLAIVISCTTRLNVGVISIVLAWIIGVYAGGMKLDEVMGGFPVRLFLTLAGVTLLFGQAQANETLDRIANRAVRSCRGNTGLVPVMFFVLAAILASMGPGNIATAALLAPMAMAAADRARIPAFLMAIMVGNGANAGSLSPFAPTGIIVDGAMARIGLDGREWHLYAYNLTAHTIVAFAGYMALGGWKLFRSRYAGEFSASEKLERQHWITISTILALIAGVLFFHIDIGMGALAGALILAALCVADHQEAIRKMPWSVIVMVCGVTVLIAFLERTNGMSLFTELLAKISTRSTVTGVVAFVTGLVSVYSSTSGVVLPAFLPTIPGLVERLGGGDPVAIASSMSVGGHLVDVSPLSTIGALCLASVASGEDERSLFTKLLAWGLSMTVVGAVACYLIF